MFQIPVVCQEPDRVSMLTGRSPAQGQYLPAGQQGHADWPGPAPRAAGRGCQGCLQSCSGRPAGGPYPGLQAPALHPGCLAASAGCTCHMLMPRGALQPDQQ